MSDVELILFDFQVVGFAWFRLVRLVRLVLGSQKLAWRPPSPRVACGDLSLRGFCNSKLLLYPFQIFAELVADQQYINLWHEKTLDQTRFLRNC